MKLLVLFLFVGFEILSYLCNVIQLGRHIEILLLDNDCVIVPDFGGFVAHHVSARYDTEERVWLPPMRTLGFNPQLRINDSLLVQSYVNAYDISYPEALRRIEDEVNELSEQLQHQGAYEMEGIGVLSINEEGSICFEPCEAGILSPTLYALPVCPFLTLKEGLSVQSSQNVQSSQRGLSLTSQNVQSEVASESEDGPDLLEFIDDNNDAEDTEERAIQIKLSWVRNAVAVAAAVVAFFLMATPIANSNLGSRTMSDLRGNLLYKLMPQDTNMVPASPVAESTESIDSPVIEETAVKTPNHVETEKTDNSLESAKAVDSAKSVRSAVSDSPAQYCIVLASQVKKSNAEYYVEQLKKRGYGEAEVYEHNNIVRVVYGSYATEADAYTQLRKMNDKEEFSEAWVYRIRG